MDRGTALNLGPGDEVFWNDPDEGTCSRTLKILSVDVWNPEDEDPVLSIMDMSGAIVECFASELS